MITFSDHLVPSYLTSVDSAMRKRGRHTCPDTTSIFCMVSPVTCATGGDKREGKGARIRYAQTFQRVFRKGRSGHSENTLTSHVCTIQEKEQMFPEYPVNCSVTLQGTSSDST